MYWRSKKTNHNVGIKAMKAVIMAGGKGTRLSRITTEIPKPLINLNGKPVLQYQIENMAPFTRLHK